MAMESMTVKGKQLDGRDRNGAILLSSIYIGHGKLQKAICVLERVYKETKKVYGKEHTETLARNIQTLLLPQGSW